MTDVIEVTDLTKRYRDTLAVDDVSASHREGHHLRPARPQRRRQDHRHVDPHGAELRDAAATSGSSAQKPTRTPRCCGGCASCARARSTPTTRSPRTRSRAARLFFPNWNQELADRLIDDFQLPLKRRIKKLSRGQLSAVGVIIGLASRAEITFFDEPYLGLDAVARQIFYDRLLEDYTEHPRTVILSSHLIDEVSNLIETRARDRPRPASSWTRTRMPSATAPRTSSATPPRSTPSSRARGHPPREPRPRDFGHRARRARPPTTASASPRAGLDVGAGLAAAAHRPPDPARRRRRCRRRRRRRPSDARRRRAAR